MYNSSVEPRLKWVSYSYLDFNAPSLRRRSPESQFRHVEFDKTRPFLALPQGVMTAFNSQNTLFYHSAFWGLLLPITTRFREDDIWRGCAGSLVAPVLV